MAERIDSLMRFLHTAVAAELTSIRDRVSGRPLVDMFQLNSDLVRDTKLWEGEDMDVFEERFELDVSDLVGCVPTGDIATHRKAMREKRKVLRKCMVRNLSFAFPHLGAVALGITKDHPNGFMMALLMQPRMVERRRGDSIDMAYYLVCTVRLYEINIQVACSLVT